MGEREGGGKGHNRPAKAGDHVRLTFKVSNERKNRPLSDFCVKDSNLGDGCLECEPDTSTATIPEGDFVCHVDYKVPQFGYIPDPRLMI